MEVMIGGFGAIKPASSLFEPSSSSGDGSPPPGSPEEAASEVSSSIGSPSDDEDDEIENFSSNADEAESKFRGSSLLSMDSLEDSLPNKRGLSSHFSGKSKSFASLADVCTVGDLKKNENPLNKRRRLLIASKWAKKSFYSFGNPKSMPLLALMENDDSLGEEDDDCGGGGGEKLRDHHGRRGLEKFKSFKTRCFSLADLQEEHSELDDDDDDDDDHHDHHDF